MADIDKLEEQGWELEEIIATYVKNKDKVDDDGDSLAKRKEVKLNEENLQTLAKSDAKDDMKTIKELRQDLKALRDKRKEAKDKLEELKAKK